MKFSSSGTSRSTEIPDNAEVAGVEGSSHHIDVRRRDAECHASQVRAMNQKTGSLVATLFLVAAILVLFMTHNLLARVPAGMAIQVAAALLMLWARFTFGMRSFHAAANPTQGGMVTHGPYRYWRHPIYAAVLLFVWTGVFSQARTPTLQAVALAFAATLMTAVRISAEEQLLKGMFPGYPAYAAKTKRLIPFLF